MKDLKLFYSTEEVADYFDISTSRVRYYVTQFNLRIESRAGNKAFSKKDMLKLGKIISLVDEERYTIKGAKEELKNTKGKDSSKEQAIAKLKDIRNILVRLRGESALEKGADEAGSLLEEES